MKKIIDKFFGAKKDVELDIDDERTKKKEMEPADFETAIAATGFGKFNIVLLLTAIPCGWASMFETTTTSYIIPVAECDLFLSIEDKGYLISITYLGMLSSSMIWGYLSDTLGRRKLLVIGLFLSACFTFLAGISQTFPMLLFSKFMGGFIINGPFAVLTTVLSEYHSAKYRARVVLSMGIVFGFANLFLPLFAWSLLPHIFSYNFLGLNLHSWNVFILVTGIPSLISAVANWFFIPETPKFLMSTGQNEEAMKVFKMVYAMNSGKDPETFPIKILFDENTQTDHKMISSNKMEAFKNGFSQIKPLFMPPQVAKACLVCILQMGTLMGLNSIRLWLPQLFTAINDYQSAHDGKEGDLCVTLESFSMNKTVINKDDSICVVNTDNSSVYTNLMVVSVVTIVGYLFVGSLINALGKKNVYITLGILSGCFAFGIFFAKNAMTVTALSSICITLSGINTNVLLTVIVDLFPTSLRTMAVCLSMMIGRFGAMIGNIIFPQLIQVGCLPPFLFIALMISGCGLLAILLPKTDMKALE